MSPAQLTEQFARLGAREPHSWASSQLEEGIPQLHRFVFLRQAWQAIVSRDNVQWIDSIQRAGTTEDAESRDALARLLAAGIDQADLTLVVRNMQRDLLFSLCYLLEEPGELDPQLDDFGWGLFTIDSERRAGEHIPMLHESVIETDPETSPADGQ
jgi:hypothetical protein